MKIKNKILYFFKYIIIKTKIKAYERDGFDMPYYGFCLKNNKIWLTVHPYNNKKSCISDFKIKNESVDIRFLLFKQTKEKLSLQDDFESTFNLNEWLKKVVNNKNYLIDCEF